MKRNALFVGVNNYSDRDIHPLRFAVEDATDLAGFFKHCAKFNRAEVLTDPRNCDAVLDRVHDMLCGLGPGDEFLFFFAGHGVTTHDGHRLVCSSDKLSAVKHAWAGLPLERLKLETAGPFNRLFLLDACRSDVLATNRGASCAMETGTRDLIMEGASSADEKDGVLTILCSCDDDECAGESAVLRHGLFSKAMLEMLDEGHRDGRIVLVDDDFVYRRLPERMRLLAQESDMDFSQKPQKRGPAILLLDGATPKSWAQTNSTATTQIQEYVICPKCGKHNLVTNTFKCKVCGRDNICLAHFSQDNNSCIDCADAASVRAPQNLTPQQFYDKGVAYLKGDHCSQSEVEAFKCFEKAASAGLVKAMEELAECYYNGRGITKDYSRAHWWLTRAAVGGKCSGYAYYFLGFLFEHGQGVGKSIDRAESFYRKAVEKGNSNAKEPLQKILSAKGRYGGREVQLIGQYENKLEYLQSLTSDPSTKEAMKCWYQGDYARAWALLKSAPQNCPAVQYCKADMLADDRRSRRCGLAPDEATSFALMKSAAKQGNVLAMWEMAWKDKSHAESWLRRAANNGHAEAIKKLAELLAGDADDIKQWGVKKDLAESLRYLKFGAKLGAVGVIQQWLYAIKYPKRWPMTISDFEELRQCLVGLDAKYAWAAYEVGRIYELGLSGAVDLQQAKRWYEKCQWYEAKARVNSLAFKLKMKYHGRIGKGANLFEILDFGLLWDWVRGYSDCPWCFQPIFVLIMTLFGACLWLLLYWRHLLEME